jgi:hypothetical protein
MVISRFYQRRSKGKTAIYARGQYNVFTPGRQRNHKLYSFNERAFDAPLSRDAAYWLGFLMADGALSRPPVNQLRLVLQARDRDHVAAFQAFLQAEHPNPGLYQPWPPLRGSDRHIPTIKRGAD